MDWIPVVTAEEMRRLEASAIQNGASADAFMREAGKQVALQALNFLEQNDSPINRGGKQMARCASEAKPDQSEAIRTSGVNSKTIGPRERIDMAKPQPADWHLFTAPVNKQVALIVGKGNNGGDAYAAGIELLKRKVKVRAWSLYPLKECSSLNQKLAAEFKKQKGEIVFAPWDFQKESLLLDGILGTGFEGQVEGAVAQAIQRVCRSGKPVLSIDIPSGLDATTGEVRGSAIKADITVTLGFAKSGFFLREGWNHLGQVRVVDFGLPKNVAQKARLFAHLPHPATLFDALPPIVRNRHKYQAGYVVGLAGSALFRGAPKLSGLAALRMGAGIVRIFHEGEIGEAPFELICQPFDEKAWHQELERASSVFVGPGQGKLKLSLKKITTPLVVDADALQKGTAFPKRAILTPHRGEMLRLLGLKKAIQEEELLKRCQKFAEAGQIILVLKGAPTYIFSPKQVPVIILYGDPGMATAGSGDVLTGMLASLLAQKVEPFEAAVLGTVLHGLAGEMAAQEKTSYGLIASDLIDFLPKLLNSICQLFAERVSDLDR